MTECSNDDVMIPLLSIILGYFSLRGPNCISSDECHEHLNFATDPFNKPCSYVSLWTTSQRGCLHCELLLDEAASIIRPDALGKYTEERAVSACRVALCVGHVDHNPREYLDVTE